MVTFGLGPMQKYWVCIIFNLNNSWSTVKVTRVRNKKIYEPSTHWDS
jgi:hypothetical protein